MEKTKKLALASVSLLVALFIAIHAASIPKNIPEGVAVVFEGGAPPFLREMASLRIVSKELSAELASRIAREMFNVSGAVEGISGGWRVVNGSKEVKVFRSGCLQYFDNYKMWHTYGGEEEFPAFEECRRIAEAYLASFLDAGFLDEKLRISFNYFHEDATTVVLNNGTLTRLINNKRVDFAITYNGTAFHGQGMRVYIGRGGEVIGFIGCFWKVEEAEPVQVITLEQALERLRDNQPESNVARLIVKAVDLVYFAPSPEAEGV